MLGQGSLSVVDQIEADMQAYVGRFLADKATLQQLQQNPDLQVQGQATKLLIVQNTLEGQLPEATNIIGNIKTGSYSIGDEIWLTNFMRQVVKQVTDVDSLSKGQPISTGTPISPMLLLVGGAVVLGGIWWYKRR